MAAQFPRAPRDPRAGDGPPRRGSRSASLRSEAWSRAHALGMCGALLACLMLRAAWPIALWALPSFVGFGMASRRELTPTGRVGLANAVTALRLAAVLGLAAAPALLPSRSAAMFVTGVLLLDGLDGWLARQRDDASAFGAHFDMEADALFVLVLTVRLWLVEGYAPWVVFAGVLRYGYVLALWLAPALGHEAPRSSFGRYAFVTLMVGLTAGLLLRGGWGNACVALGTLAVSVSFARPYFSQSSK